MKFQPCAYNWSAFRDGDILFSHGCDLVGWAIRVGQHGKYGPMDLSQPNHAGFLYSIEDQWFAAEVGFRGITLTSIDRYTVADNQIVGLMRYKGFDDLAVRAQWRKDMARWIRKKQESGYDINGAIYSALKWWPWHGDPDKEFCSEDVGEWLQKLGCDWLQSALDPLELYDIMTRRKDVFSTILGYKIIPQPGAI